jgi:hypothetical protein
MIAIPVGSSTSRTASSTAGLVQTGERFCRRSIAGDGADHPHLGAEAGGRDCLIRAFPPRMRRPVAPLSVSPALAAAGPSRRGRG